ncbi:hypothetical protein DV737_g3217, partial [Chaetothyriales sp. CBS 132003]
MTDKLPPQLLALFQPRPPVRYIAPLDDSPEQRATKQSTISGLAAFLPQLDDYKAHDLYEPTESWLQRRDRIRLEKQARRDEMQNDSFEGFKPQNDAKIKGDPLRTLFVGRLSYDVKEQDLEREFGRFGTVERIRIVRDETKDEPAAAKKRKKPHRGYAFIVFERERDMKAAYKETDGLRIKDRRVVVDVERGRMAPAKPTFGQGPLSGSQGQGFRPGGYGGRGAPSGPSGGRSGGGYGGGSNGYEDRRNGYGGGGRDHRGQTGSNREPLDDDYGSRKRYHDNDYDDPRKRRY